MEDISEATVAGILSKAPYVNDPRTVAKINIEVNIKDKKDWHTGTTFDKGAIDAIANLNTGDFVKITGRLASNTWKKNGVEKFDKQIVFFKSDLYVGNGEKEKDSSDVGEDDLPF